MFLLDDEDDTLPILRIVVDQAAQPVAFEEQNSGDGDVEKGSCSIVHVTLHRILHNVSVQR